MKSGVYDRLVKWIGQPEVEGWEVDLDPHQPTVFDMDIQTAVTLDWPEEVCDRYFENLNT